MVVVCDIARLNLKIFPPELISKAAERLRDKKVTFLKVLVYFNSIYCCLPSRLWGKMIIF